jgi:hypothetical protein
MERYHFAASSPSQLQLSTFSVSKAAIPFSASFRHFAGSGEM